MILDTFKKQSSFNKLRKNVKFGIDLVDSMVNTLIYCNIKSLRYPVTNKYYSMTFV